MSQPTHLVICRAGAADAEGSNAQAKIACGKEPPESAIDGFREAIATIYREGFGEEPARVAVVVLPYFEELDGDGDDGEAAR